VRQHIRALSQQPLQLQTHITRLRGELVALKVECACLIVTSTRTLAHTLPYTPAYTHAHVQEERQKSPLSKPLQSPADLLIIHTQGQTERQTEHEMRELGCESERRTHAQTLVQAKARNAGAAVSFSNSIKRGGDSLMGTAPGCNFTSSGIVDYATVDYTPVDAVAQGSFRGGMRVEGGENRCELKERMENRCELKERMDQSALIPDSKRHARMDQSADSKRHAPSCVFAESFGATAAVSTARPDVAEAAAAATAAAKVTVATEDNETTMRVHTFVGGGGGVETEVGERDGVRVGGEGGGGKAATAFYSEATEDEAAASGAAGNGVASFSSLSKIIGLLCRIWSLLYGSFAKGTYNFKEPTNRSHPAMGTYACILVIHGRENVNGKPSCDSRRSAR